MELLSEVKWRNAEKRRVYRCVAGRDLLGDWFVTRYWSAADTKQGGTKTSLHKSKNDVFKAVSTITRERSRRGYEEVHRIERH